MLPLFTQLLKDFLVRQNIMPTGRVALGPPDRAFVTALPQGQSVNVYLADIRENRKLRTHERRREDPGAGPSDKVRESYYPAWVDAHYLITAWDTAIDPSARALKEHEILAAVSSALLAGDPFTPSEVYPGPTNAQVLAVTTPVRNAAEDRARRAGASQAEIIQAGNEAANAAAQALTDRLLAPLRLWPEEFWLPGLPYQVLPPDGFPKLSEFWTTMGAGSAWKPVVYLLAAVPVELKPQFEHPIVTTLTTESGQTADALGRKLIRAIDRDGYRSGTDRRWYRIGGFVSKFDGPEPLAPVKRAKVVLQLAGDPASNPPVPPMPLQETRTDDAGKYQFAFVGPLPGQQSRFQVVVQATGLQAAPLDVVLSPADPFPHDVVMRP
jgi:hypothetical protein